MNAQKSSSAEAKYENCLQCCHSKRDAAGWHPPYIRVAPNFGYGKSKIRPFSPNPAKFGSRQISGRIWQTPMQLQCVQLITDKN